MGYRPGMASASAIGRLQEAAASHLGFYLGGDDGHLGSHVGGGHSEVPADS